jgi:hypothetical protein
MNKKKGIRFATEKLCNDYNNINRECLSFVLGSDVNRACLILKNVFFDSMVIPALARKIRYELFLDLNRIPHPKIITDFIELPDLRYVIFFHSSSPIFYSANHYCRSIIFELKSRITNFKRMINRDLDEGHKRHVGE